MYKRQLLEYSAFIALHVLRCVLLEIALNAGIVLGKAPAASVSLSRQDAAVPHVRAHMLAHFMVRLYIAVVCK